MHVLYYCAHLLAAIIMHNIWTLSLSLSLSLSHTHTHTHTRTHAFVHFCMTYSVHGDKPWQKRWVTFNGTELKYFKNQSDKDKSSRNIVQLSEMIDIKKVPDVSKVGAFLWYIPGRYMWQLCLFTPTLQIDYLIRY